MYTSLQRCPLLVVLAFSPTALPAAPVHATNQVFLAKQVGADALERNSGATAASLTDVGAGLTGVNGSSEPSPADQVLALDRRKSISSYRTRDGRRHEWLGTVEPLGADSVLFITAPEPDRGLIAAKPEVRLALAREDVQSISGRSVALGAGLFILFGLATVAYTAMAAPGWTLW